MTYKFACGSWIERTSIPDDEFEMNPFRVLNNKSRIQLQTTKVIADAPEPLNSYISFPRNIGIKFGFATKIITLNKIAAEMRSSMNFENRWVLRSALNFASDGEIVREVGREFQRKGPEKAKADLAKECLTRVKKKREEEDDRKPGRLGSINISDKYFGNNLD
ncbi:hypothetical protein HELRODRAFT_181957 [Helobdella robusta]|uniref:Uncharacterized protein n=1 Tax=Helobdella robusta TaxID=6412 RepID=T1FHI5_HELRO|nr:hypothetical protein HELRODRAFT_181957 [Helobdella robusta]ESN91901.1 hypothetical protein HELRODRAFT_181957 [Helobdella robusta]